MATSEYQLARDVLELERAEVALHKALTLLKKHFSEADHEFYAKVKQQETAWVS